MGVGVLLHPTKATLSSVLGSSARHDAYGCSLHSNGDFWRCGEVVPCGFEFGAGDVIEVCIDLDKRGVEGLGVISFVR